MDPWTSPKSDPFVQTISGPIRPDLVAFEVYGLLSLRSEPAPTDFRAWTTLLDQTRNGQIPLAVSGKSDGELLNLVLWFGEGVLGPQKLGETLESLSLDPTSALPEDGSLSPEHPWTAIVNEIRRWVDRGRFAPNWWDYSMQDVSEAVASGRARWGLTWSAEPLSRQPGFGSMAVGLAPTWPDRRSLALIGRWLLLAESGGWATPTAREESKARFYQDEDPSRWLQKGLLLARFDRPFINQETKSLAQGLLSAGSLVSAPPSPSDLSRWKPLLDAVRTSIRR